MRRGRLPIGEIDLHRIGAGIGQRQTALVLVAAIVFLGHVLVFAADIRDIIGLLIRQQVRDHADRAAGIGDIDRLALVIARVDLDRRMHAAGGRAADQKRDMETLALHLGGHMHHLVQRRRDQARQPDHIDLLGLCNLKDLRRRDHHAKVDDLVIVAGQHDADDVLADIMHIALHRRHQDLAVGIGLSRRGLLGLHIGQQIGHGLLHDAGRFHHLRQEHLAGPEQVADDVHPGHQRAFDDMQRAFGLGAGFLGIALDEFGDAVHQRMFQPLLDRPFAPAHVLLARLGPALAAIFLGQFQHPLGRIGAAVQDHILAGLAQFLVDLVIDGQLAGIDDAHIHPRLNGVVKEDRMHRLAHRFVAAEAEGKVRDPARDMDMRQGLDDPAGGVDEIDAVIVVFLDSRRHGEDVRVEDDILGREADLLRQDLIGAGADLDLAVFGIGLPGLIKSHDHHRRPVGTAQARVMQEGFLALFQGNRVHHRLALNAFQPGLDHLPFRGIDHDRHPGDIGFRGDQVQVIDHGLFAVDQALIHVDVDDLGAVLDLIAGHIQRRREIAIGDQLAETGRAGDVGAFAHVHKGNVGGLRKRLQPRKAQGRRDLGDFAGRDARHGLGNGADMFGGRAAAAADDIDQTLAREFGHLRGHLGGGFVVSAHLVRQAGIGIGADQRVGHVRDLGQMWAHGFGAKGAVQPDGQGLGVADRMPEGGGRLARQRAPRQVGDRARDHHRQAQVLFDEDLFAGEDGGLGVQRVEDRLDQDQVGAAIHQAPDLFRVSRRQLIEGDRPEARIVHIRADRSRAVRRPERAGHETRPPVFRRRPIQRRPRQPRAFDVQVIDLVLQPVIGLRDGGRGEGVGFHDIRAGLGIAVMDFLDRLRPGQVQKVVIALLRMVGMNMAGAARAMAGIVVLG